MGPVASASASSWPMRWIRLNSELKGNLLSMCYVPGTVPPSQQPLDGYHSRSTGVETKNDVKHFAPNHPFPEQALRGGGRGGTKVTKRTVAEPAEPALPSPSPPSSLALPLQTDPLHPWASCENQLTQRDEATVWPDGVGDQLAALYSVLPCSARHSQEGGVQGGPMARATPPRRGRRARAGPLPLRSLSLGTPPYCKAFLTSKQDSPGTVCASFPLESMSVL